MQLVRPGPSRSQCLLKQLLAFGDLRAVPPGAVLVGEEHHLSGVAGARVPPRVGEQQQRQQGGRLRLAGQQPRQCTGEAYRLGRTGAPRTSSGPEAARSPECIPSILLVVPWPAVRAVLHCSAPATRNPRPALSCAFARTMRCATVGSGTMNAVAMLHRAPGRRRCAASGRSAADGSSAGWQHMKMSPSSSGRRRAPGRRAGTGLSAATAGPGALAARPSDHAWPPPPSRPRMPAGASGRGPCAWPRRPAIRPGCAATPSAGHLTRASAHASCAASSAISRSPLSLAATATAPRQCSRKMWL